MIDKKEVGKDGVGLEEKKDVGNGGEASLKGNQKERKVNSKNNGELGS